MFRTVGLRVVLLIVPLVTSAARPGELSAAEAKEVTGKVSAVTLYRGQAMVTRSVPIEAADGEIEIIVTDLPQEVVGDSLFAEGNGIEVRAVRFRTRAVGEEPREEVRKLDEQIKEVQKKIARNQKMQEMQAKRAEYLDNLEQFVAGTGKADLEKGALDAQSLEKVTLFAFEERGKIVEEMLRLAEEAETLKGQLSLLQRKQSELTTGSSRTVREAVLFLSKREAGEADVQLKYLVNGAGWLPAYNVRANQDERGVRVEYHALVTQMTGENWQSVPLALSTASPSLSANVPGLAPFRVSLSAQDPKTPKQAVAGSMLRGQYDALHEQLRAARQAQTITQSLSSNLDFNWKMNKAINDLNLLELATGKDDARLLRLEQLQETEALSISYQIAGAVSLASRSDQQMVEIMELELPAEYYHVATPVLSGYVYREAELKNTSENDLLGGPLTVYLNGRFVGGSEMPTVASGQSFVVGLGADSQLRTRRDLVDRTESVQGGNRELGFKYRLMLENYKEAPVTVRVIDRIPLAERSADIRITLGDVEDKLSEDKLYLQLERPKGILRWDIDVPARAVGEDARSMTYDYRLEFERNHRLATPVGPGASEQQQEFEQIQQKRLRR